MMLKWRLAIALPGRAMAMVSRCNKIMPSSGWSKRHSFQYPFEGYKEP